MNKGKLDFEWTAEDVDKAFLDAARGEGKEQNKGARPNVLEILKSKSGLQKVKNERAES
jgi:hypothetical protein